MLSLLLYFVALMYVLVYDFQCAIACSVICDCGISWAFHSFL